MRLTPELISQSDTALNALGDRELDLRGHKIPAIENLGVTRDLNDTIDFTDNDIRSLSNFPALLRLHTLIMANNLVSRLDRKLANSLPRLTTLILTHNALEDISTLTPLSRFPLLEYLSIMGNPVSRKDYYREFVIWKCKSLRVLDFQRVTQKEREHARKLMETAEGKPTSLASKLSAVDPSKGAAKENGEPKTFDVGNTQAQPSRRMTAEERKAIEAAIENSTSLEEIKQLENRLRLGYAITS